ncbi:Replication protein A 70 kDa DNA-binding subunit C [Diplonema papillatum]|nr:Replication protein A 70 kDa DNA-binding subunit C [Diplonema papillatum]
MSNACFKCGQVGHYSNACPSRGAGGGGGGYGGGAAAQTAPSGGSRSEVLHNFQGSGYTGQPDFDYHGAEALLFPISSLTEVHDTKWFIKARVVEKSDVRKWSNARSGEGILASVTLVDESGGAIRATFFKQAVEKFYNLMQVNQVFLFGHGRIKPAQKRFSTLPHDYELSFDEHSVVQPLMRDDPGMMRIPNQVAANFTSLRDLMDVEVGRSIDLQCIVREVGPLTSIRRKSDNSELRKRTLKVCDNTTTMSFELTVWGDNAEQCTARVGSGVVAKSCRVGKFMNAINLNANSLEVDSPQSRDLQLWWQNVGCQQTFEHMAPDASSPKRHYNRVGLDQVDIKNLGRNDKPDIVYIRGTITGLNDKNLVYPACPHPRDTGMGTPQPDQKCQKKVSSIPEGSLPLRCPLHGEVPQPQYRYIANMKVGDLTNSCFVTAFDNVAQPLFGCEAVEFANIEVAQERLAQVKKEVEWRPCLMTLRVKEELVDGQPRMKYAALNVKVLKTTEDYVQEAGFLLRDIDRYHTEKVR